LSILPAKEGTSFVFAKLMLRGFYFGNLIYHAIQKWTRQQHRRNVRYFWLDLTTVSQLPSSKLGAVLVVLVLLLPSVKPFVVSNGAMRILRDLLIRRQPVSNSIHWMLPTAQALKVLVQSTTFMTDGTIIQRSNDPYSDYWQWTSGVPSFGRDCFVQLAYRSFDQDDDYPYGSLDLSLQNCEESHAIETDFGWICLKFLRILQYTIGRYSEFHRSIARSSGGTTWQPPRAFDGLDHGRNARSYATLLRQGGASPCALLDALHTRGYIVIDPLDHRSSDHASVLGDSSTAHVVVCDDRNDTGISLLTTASQQQFLSGYFSEKDLSCRDPLEGGPDHPDKYDSALSLVDGNSILHE
jgi:hypothetical protein